MKIDAEVVFRIWSEDGRSCEIVAGKLVIDPPDPLNLEPGQLYVSPEFLEVLLGLEHEYVA